jgi:large subunit ribosomal protein L25
MIMERTALIATSRDPGKGPARRSRTTGQIPAVLYGKGRDPVPLALDAKLFGKAMGTAAGMNVLIDLRIGEGAPVVSRVKEVQQDPIRRNMLHVDFQAIDLQEMIVVEVPLHFEGKAEGVKEGGIVEVSRRSIEVKCLPTTIPSAIPVDISALHIGESIHADDLTLPAGVESHYHENYSLVQVVAPQKEDEATPAAAVEGAVEGATPAGGAEAGAEGEAKKE